MASNMLRFVVLASLKNDIRSPSELVSEQQKLDCRATNLEPWLT